MIFFIAAMVVSVAVVSTLISTTYNFSNDIEKKGGSMGDFLLTDISIINDPVAMPYNASNKTITLYVMNTGSTSLPLSNRSIIVMINGTPFTNLTFVLPKNVTSWGQHVVLTIVVGEVTLPKQDYKLKVVVQGAVYDQITFRIS